MNLIAAFFRRIIWALITLAITGAILLILLILYLEARLPDTDALKNVQMQLPLRVYTLDGHLIGMFGEKRRIPVTLNQIPKLMINAILATEDQRFYDHAGVDFFGLSRAAIELVRTGTKSQGGSTITMQVARNFFLTRKKTYLRKLNEVLLAIKIDSALGKDKILELYLNKIYFGNRAYGVAAAAEAYYGKTLDQLTLPEMATIAGLPKAPSTLNPLANPAGSTERRNHVLARMLSQGYIDQAAYDAAIRTPQTASYHQPQATIKAPYVAEMVRRMIIDRFGEDALNQGYKVYTTINSQLQIAANQALRNGLLNYEKRHGFRYSKQNLRHLAVDRQLTEWRHYLKKQRIINGLWPAAVIHVGENNIRVLNADGETLTLLHKNIPWAANNSLKSFIRVGDIVRITLNNKGEWELSQLPHIEGTLVALDPKDGAIKALVGGFDYASSNFNRAIQAQRQAGSSFKPFIYAAALDKSFTPASVIDDAPIEIADPSLPDGVWRPQNDDHEFDGPTRLREALARSRNLVTIRLLRTIGVRYAVEYVERFGFDPKQLPKSLSIALGTASLTPLQLTSGFSVFANGGYRISPYIIQRITDAQDHTILTATPRLACADCKKRAPMVISAQTAYLITSMLHEVIRSGTGRAAQILKRTDLGGKTGTSDDQRDAWFIGFNSDLVVSAWVGYDQPRSTHEHGSQAALPIWIEFMGTALKDMPTHSMPLPPGIVRVKIDAYTGTRASEDDDEAIEEVFREEDAEKLGAPQITQDDEDNTALPADETEPMFSE